MATNPFESLATPDSVAASRLAAADAAYADQPIYTQMAGQAGARFNNAMTSAGMLTDEDRKAQHTNQVMTDAQSKYSEYIKDGSMTPDDAQAAVLEDAIKQFSGAGNWEQAIALTQPLNALRTQAAERAKLRAEATNLESKPDAKAIDQQIATLRIEADYQAKSNALEVAAQRADTAMSRAQAQNELNRLQAELLQWKLDHPPTPGGNAMANAIRKGGEKLNENVTSAAESANLMADLREQIAANPQAATLTGNLVTQIMKYGSAARATVNSSGWDAGKTIEGSQSSVWLRNNVANEKQRALVVSLAYAFARSNDPGGRLSNQDLEQAMRVVSGEGSPTSRIELLDQAFTGLARKTTNEISSKIDSGVTVGPNTRKIWMGTTQRYSQLTAKSLAKAELAAAAAPSGGPPPGLSKEEFKQWKAANPNWRP